MKSDNEQVARQKSWC